MTEISVPEGTTTIDITFALTDAGDMPITAVDASKVPSPPPPFGGLPQTGSDIDIALCVALVLISGCLAMAFGIRHKKRKRM